MANQLRAANLLKEAANLLEGENAPTSQRTSSSVDSTVRSASRALFAPYVRRGGRRRELVHSPPITYWTHRFCVIAKCQQVKS